MSYYCPLLVDLEDLQLFLVFGGARSGKTQRVGLPVIEQTIQAGPGGLGTLYSSFVFDLKASNLAVASRLHTVLEKVNRRRYAAGLPPKWWRQFSFDHATHIFNPLCSEVFASLSIDRKTSLLLRLVKAVDSEAYFRETTYNFTKRMVLFAPHARSAREFCAVARDMVDRPKRYGLDRGAHLHGRHCMLALQKFEDIPAFNATPETSTSEQWANRIEFSDLSREPGGVISIALQGNGGPIVEGLMSIFFMWIRYALQAVPYGERTRLVSGLVDEGQVLFGSGDAESHVRDLQQIRDLVSTLTITSQSEGELHGFNPTTKSTFDSNQTARLWLDSKDDTTTADLITRSGEEEYLDESTNYRNELFCEVEVGRQRKVLRRPRIRPEHIARLNRNSELALVHLPHNGLHSDIGFVRVPFHISKRLADSYQAVEQLPRFPGCIDPVDKHQPAPVPVEEAEPRSAILRPCAEDEIEELVEAVTGLTTPQVVDDEIEEIDESITDLDDLRDNQRARGRRSDKRRQRKKGG